MHIVVSETVAMAKLILFTKAAITIHCGVFSQSHRRRQREVLAVSG